MSKVTASHARLADRACRMTLFRSEASSGLAWAGVTAVQVRPPSVVRTSIIPAGRGLAGLLVQASAQPSRAETIWSDCSQTGAGAAGSEAGGAARAHRPRGQVTRSALARPVPVITHAVLPDDTTACGWRPTAKPAPVTRPVRGSRRNRLARRAFAALVTQTTPGAAASRPDPFKIGDESDVGANDSSGTIAVGRPVRGSIRVTLAPSETQAAPSPTVTWPKR